MDQIKLKPNLPPNDRDYLKTKNGDIYQVLTYYHPPVKILAVRKYAPVERAEDKKLERFHWHQRTTGIKYERVLRQYSAETMRTNMTQNTSFQRSSQLYGFPMTYIPFSEIHEYYKPQVKLKNWITYVQQVNMQKLNELSPRQREALILALKMSEASRVPLKNWGITGSCLLDMDHEKSDLDFLIYGQSATEQFLKYCKKIPQAEKGLRRPMNIELFDRAGGLVEKTGLTQDEAFDLVYRKYPILYHDKRYLSMKFCPLPSELIHNPLASLVHDRTRFVSQEYTQIQAEVLDCSWGAFYPAVIFIKSLEKVQRVVIFEQGFSNLLQKGDLIEISGLLQLVENPPQVTRNTAEPCYQILLGSQEGFGRDYIKFLNENA